jgi:four helix bundle protein
MAFRFEKLEVWRKAVALYRNVCIISEGFPKSEEYVLKSQLRRATLSISTNIAEAMGRETKRDRRYFLTVARGSAFETASLITIATEMKYVGAKNAELLEDIEEIAKMINGLIKAQK